MQVKPTMLDRLPSGGIGVDVIHGETMCDGLSVCVYNVHVLPIHHAAIHDGSFSLLLVPQDSAATR